MASPKAGTRREAPAGLWLKCDGCGAMLYKSKVEEKLDTCPECGEPITDEFRRKAAAV